MSRYGESASTVHEVSIWNERYAALWGPIIPVRMIDQGEEFDHDTGKVVFADDTLSLWWEMSGAEQVAAEIANAVWKRVSGLECRSEPQQPTRG